MSGELRLACLVALAGCGSLVTPDYRGEPLFELEGTVYMSPEVQPVLDGLDGAPLRVALFWAHSGETWTEQDVVVTPGFPSQYALALFHPPPASAHFDADWAPGGRASVGIPLLYADADLDERWTPGEAFVGGTLGGYVLHLEQGGVLPTAMGGATLLPGLYSAFVDDTGCDANGNPQFVRVDEPDASTDLYVGFFYEQLQDWSCDGALYEWVCPDDAQIDAWCGMAQSLDLTDPARHCFERCFN